jgi:hypothetical protein
MSEKNPNIQTTIFSPGGNPLYRIVCHEGDFEDANTGTYNLLFQCKLGPQGEGSHFEDFFSPNAQWPRSTTRATFNSGLNDKCSDDPYYGQRRTFLVRGMKIVLEVKNFEVKPSIAESVKRDLIKPTEYSFSLGIDIGPDQDATGEFAGPAPHMCVADFSLGKDGKVVERKIILPDWTSY